MSVRNSPRQIANLNDLEKLEDVVVDKRSHKRASNKKNRRDRHYKKQCIQNILARPEFEN